MCLASDPTIFMRTLCRCVFILILSGESSCRIEIETNCIRCHVQYAFAIICYFGGSQSIPQRPFTILVPSFPNWMKMSVIFLDLFLLAAQAHSERERDSSTKQRQTKISMPTVNWSPNVLWCDSTWIENKNFLSSADASTMHICTAIDNIEVATPRWHLHSPN